MTTILPDGDWRLTYFPEGECTVAHPDDLRTIDGCTIPARVPGNVELDLVRAAVIPEPFYGDSVRRLRAFEPCELWYTRQFTLPVDAMATGARYDLVFGGLDTLATVWVNGVEVGRAANMLIEAWVSHLGPSDGSPPRKWGVRSQLRQAWVSCHGTPH